MRTDPEKPRELAFAQKPAWRVTNVKQGITNKDLPSGAEMLLVLYESQESNEVKQSHSRRRHLSS